MYDGAKRENDDAFSTTQRPSDNVMPIYGAGIIDGVGVTSIKGGGARGRGLSVIDVGFSFICTRRVKYMLSRCKIEESIYIYIYIYIYIFARK